MKSQLEPHPIQHQDPQQRKGEQMLELVPPRILNLLAGGLFTRTGDPNPVAEGIGSLSSFILDTRVHVFTHTYVVCRLSSEPMSSWMALHSPKPGRVGLHLCDHTGRPPR